MSGRGSGAPREEPVIGYLERVEIENIRSIASLTREVAPEPVERPDACQDRAMVVKVWG